MKPISKGSWVREVHLTCSPIVVLVFRIWDEYVEWMRLARSHREEEKFQNGLAVREANLARQHLSLSLVVGTEPMPDGRLEREVEGWVN